MESARDVAEVERETARYYDAERDREKRAIDARRLAARDRFIAELAGVPPLGPVLEIGPGPGRDALALREAGLDLVGVDLSVGHATRAASRGIPMAAGTARRLPFATGSAGALWSMSTLMHIPTSDIESAMTEIRRVLVPGSPAFIGVWAGPNREEFTGPPDGTDTGLRRFFSRRSEERWRSLLALIGAIVEFEVWTYGTDGEHQYHFAVVISAK